MLEAVTAALRAENEELREEVEFYKECLEKIEYGHDIVDTIIEQRDFYKRKLKEGQEKLYSGKELNTFTEWFTKGSTELKIYIECLAAAYCKLCDIPPGRVVLCTTIENETNKILYWFESKDKELKPINKFDYA